MAANQLSAAGLGGFLAADPPAFFNLLGEIVSWILLAVFSSNDASTVFVDLAFGLPAMTLSSLWIVCSAPCPPYSLSLSNIA